jgi:hypothetical protein
LELALAVSLLVAVQRNLTRLAFPGPSFFFFSSEVILQRGYMELAFSVLMPWQAAFTIMADHLGLLIWLPLLSKSMGPWSRFDLLFLEYLILVHQYGTLAARSDWDNFPMWLKWVGGEQVHFWPEPAPPVGWCGLTVHMVADHPVYYPVLAKLFGCHWVCLVEIDLDKVIPGLRHLSVGLVCVETSLLQLW